MIFEVRFNWQHTIALHWLPEYSTAKDFDHKAHTMSWTAHDCAGLFESEKLERFKVKRSVIDKGSGRIREWVITA